jgi:osmoprotectant transport system permease protein
VLADSFFRWSFVTQQWGMIGHDLFQHVILTLIAVGIGFAISLPVALVASKVVVVKRLALSFASGLYVVPSLALFVILGSWTGLETSVLTAEIALVGYTLLILIRNTIAGLDAVPADARDAARALGYTPLEALLRVEFPLALPYIFAGLRVATATVIGLVSVTALIGLGGLGQLFIYGFNTDYYTPIIVGLVLSVALAAVADALIVGSQRVLVPWGRSVRTRSVG